MNPARSVQMAGATELLVEASDDREEPTPGPCSMQPQTLDALAGWTSKVENVVLNRFEFSG